MFCSMPSTRSRFNSGNPQYQIQFFDTNGGFISSTSFASVAAIGTNWTTISNNYPAPANAASMNIEFLEAVGGGGHWVTLFDNAKVNATAESGPPIFYRHISSWAMSPLPERC